MYRHSGDHGVGVHSTYLLVDAPYYDGTSRKLVWTGSHNYSYSALRRNDEVLLKIRDRGIYQAFLQNWRLMRNRITSR